MLDYSGQGESSNNRGNPPLRDAERARGVSGEATHGEKKKANASDRRSARKHDQG